MVLVIACGGEKLDTLSLTIDEMCCPECQQLVQHTLMQQPGIKELSLNYEQHSVVITLRPDEISPASLIRSLREQGFTVNGEKGDSTAYAVLPQPCRE